MLGIKHTASKIKNGFNNRLGYTTDEIIQNIAQGFIRMKT